MGNQLSFIIAFSAGVVSFLAPCVLPLVPAFLAYLAGSSVGATAPNRREIVVNSLFFVLGFSVVFATLGVLLNTLLVIVAYDVQLWLSRLGGIIIIIFGLYLVKLIKIPWLDREHKFKVATKSSSRYFTSFLFGVSFAAGWTPCVGAALGSILALSATQPAVAFYLLMTYALGLGLPFIVIAFFTAQAVKIINQYAKVLQYISLGFGIVLIILGILVFTQNLNLITNLEFINKIIQS